MHHRCMFYDRLSVCWREMVPSIFFFNYPSTTEIYTLSLHDALPISPLRSLRRTGSTPALTHAAPPCIWTLLGAPRMRSEEHTSELQSRRDLVCRLLLEKKKSSTTRPLVSFSENHAYYHSVHTAIVTT